MVKHKNVAFTVKDSTDKGNVFDPSAFTSKLFIAVINETAYSGITC